jgi:hypothetical protein
MKIFAKNTFTNVVYVQTIKILTLEQRSLNLQYEVSATSTLSSTIFIVLT